MKQIAARIAATFAFAAALPLAAHADDATLPARPDARTIATTVCAACHGPDGNSLVPLFPRLAGQQQTYLLKQLDDYKSDRRHSDVMAPIIANVDRSDFAGLAAYFSEQKPKPGVSGEADLVARGRRLYLSGDIDAGIPPCAACHEARAEGDGRYPRLAGQSAVYATQTLTDLKQGNRHNDPARVMRNISMRLDDDAMKAIVAYLEAQ